MLVLLLKSTVLHRNIFIFKTEFYIYLLYFISFILFYFISFILYINIFISRLSFELNYLANTLIAWNNRMYTVGWTKRIAVVSLVWRVSPTKLPIRVAKNHEFKIRIYWLNVYPLDTRWKISLFLWNDSIRYLALCLSLSDPICLSV